jgi:hypothetical protein
LHDFNAILLLDTTMLRAGYPPQQSLGSFLVIQVPLVRLKLVCTHTQHDIIHRQAARRSVGFRIVSGVREKLQLLKSTALASAGDGLPLSMTFARHTIHETSFIMRASILHCTRADSDELS